MLCVPSAASFGRVKIILADQKTHNSDDEVEDYNQILVLQIREVVFFKVNSLKEGKYRIVQLVFKLLNFDQLTHISIKKIFFPLFWDQPEVDSPYSI